MGWTVHALTIAAPRQRYDELAEVAWARSVPPGQEDKRRSEAEPYHYEHTACDAVEQALRERGPMTTSEIAQAAGVSMHSVGQTLSICSGATVRVKERKHGVGGARWELIPDDAPAPPNKPDKPVRERNRRLAMKWLELKRECNCSVSTIQKYCKQLGIKSLIDASEDELTRLKATLAARPPRGGKRAPAASEPIEDVTPRKGLAPKERRKRAIEAAALRAERHQAEEAPERDDQEQPERPLCAAVLTALYPDGLEPERYAEAVRVVLAVSTVPAEVR